MGGGCISGIQGHQGRSGRNGSNYHLKPIQLTRSFKLQKVTWYSFRTIETRDCILYPWRNEHRHADEGGIPRCLVSNYMNVGLEAVSQVDQRPIMRYQLSWGNLEKYSIREIETMVVFAHTPNWDTIKLIGGSKTVALAGFFPFVGYLVLMNENFSSYLVLVTDPIVGDGRALDIEFDRLRQIYFAMIWLSVGVLLYRLFCPFEIKVFRDRYEFFSKELAIANPYRLISFQDRLLLSPWNAAFTPDDLKVEVEKSKELKLDQISIRALSYPILDNDEGSKSLDTYKSDSGIQVSQLLNTHYDFRNNTLGLIRGVTFCSFFVGYLKLSWPALEVLVILLLNRVG